MLIPAYSSSKSSDKLVILMKAIEQLFTREKLQEVETFQLTWTSEVGDVVSPNLLLEFKSQAAEACLNESGIPCVNYYPISEASKIKPESQE